MNSSSLSFQFSGTLVMSPGISSSPVRSKTSKPSKHKVVRMESRTWAGGLPEGMMTGHWFLDSWILHMGEIAPCAGH